MGRLLRLRGAGAVVANFADGGAAPPAAALMIGAELLLW